MWFLLSSTLGRHLSVHQPVVTIAYCTLAQHLAKQVQSCLQAAAEQPKEDADAATPCAAPDATPDQAAFVLSVPRRRPMDETQETLRTSAFPSTHVKDKWAKNLYIAGKSLRLSLQSLLKASASLWRPCGVCLRKFSVSAFWSHGSECR